MKSASILLRAVLLGVLGVAASNSVAHATKLEGKVYTIAFTRSLAYVMISVGDGPSADARPQCHESDHVIQYAIDVSTAKGKALLTLALAALNAGKPVVVYGTGACLTVDSTLNPPLQIEEVAKLSWNP